MSYMAMLAAVLFLTASLFANASPANPGNQTAMKWTMETFEKHLPGCESHPASACAKVNLTYPSIISGPSEKGKAEISSAVQDMVLTPIEKGKAPRNQEEFASQILSHYQAWLKRGGDKRIPWTVERKIDVDYSSPQVFSIRLLERVEQGRQRAAKNTVYFNFRPEDGTLIQLGELIQPGKMAEFKEIAQKHFHNKDEKVPAGEDVKAPGQEFSLPKNFAIEKDGLRFRYEEDQVNPHSIRTPEFVVPYKEIRNLLQHDVKLP